MTIVVGGVAEGICICSEVFLAIGARSGWGEDVVGEGITSTVIVIAAEVHDAPSLARLF